MRTEKEIKEYADATVSRILRESKKGMISKQEAELLAYKGLCRYEDLKSVRETTLALDMIREYAISQGKKYQDFLS